MNSQTAISLIPVRKRLTKRTSRNRRWIQVRQRREVRIPATIEVAKETGPLSAIFGKRVVVVADAQNLDRGARDLGAKMSWALLGEVLDAAAASASRHAILSAHPGDERRMNYFVERGWIPHATTRRTVRTHKGLERKGNADFLLAFLAGVVVSRASADVVLVASGDGDLVEEVAIGIRSLQKERSIVTMSLAGSTAGRLNAEKNELITANIEIGKDCLRPNSIGRREQRGGEK